ncbi:MAG: DUF2788 domain-containing protein [Acidiferrobacterales bacterium]
MLIYPGFLGTNFLALILLTMDIETFESWSLTIGISSLILYMTYIIYRLAKDSNAGKFGYFILFITLGLGIVGYIVKTLLEYFLAI